MKTQVVARTAVRLWLVQLDDDDFQTAGLKNGY